MSRKRRAVRTEHAVRRYPKGWLIGAALTALLSAGVWTLAWRDRVLPNRADRVAYAPVARPLTFPISVQTAPPEVRALYEFAARRPDVLRYLPCFCGCGRVHRSNYDCFIDEVRPDGSVVIDSMSFT